MNCVRRTIVSMLILLAPALAEPALAQTGMFDGKPVFAEGDNLGYYVWREGDTWKVRWTTRGMTRLFTGSVVAEGGELKSLKRIDVEEERRVLYPGRAPHVFYGPRGRPHVRGGRAPVVVTREQAKIEKEGDHKIVFISRTTGDLDGFDFKVKEGVQSLRFVLQIEGRLLPQQVQVGANNRRLPTLPFVVRLSTP